jgi:hypothetical protein
MKLFWIKIDVRKSRLQNDNGTSRQFEVNGGFLVF